MRNLLSPRQAPPSRPEPCLLVIEFDDPMRAEIEIDRNVWGTTAEERVTVSVRPLSSQCRYIIEIRRRKRAKKSAAMIITSFAIIDYLRGFET